MKHRNQFLKYRLFSKADDDPGGGGGGGKDNSTVNVDQFNQLVSTVGDLAQGMGTIQEAVTALAQQGRASSEALADDDDMDDGTDGADLESLSRADFASHLLKQINKQFSKPIEELGNQIKEVQSSVSQVDSKTVVQHFADGHKDFWDWKPELEAIVKETPGISVERAYALARQENPDKAKELDQKYSPPSDEGKETKPFGGLTPTSGQTSKSTTMSSEEAVEAAWNDTMAELGTAIGNEGV